MSSFLTLGIIETKPDPKVDLIKKEFSGIADIKRKAVREGQFVIAEPIIEVFGDAVTDFGTSVNVGSGDNVVSSDGDGVRHGDKHVDDSHEILFDKKVNHDDGHTSDGYGGYGGFTPFSGHATSFGPSSSSWDTRENGQPKKVNNYKLVKATNKSKLNTLIRSKKALKFYSIHEFRPKDFKNMIDMKYVDEIIYLIRERHLNFIEHYDLWDRIMDLKFYNNFLSRYNKLGGEVTTPSGRKIKDLIIEFLWDDDIIDYCRGKRPFPSVMDWIGQRGILKSLVNHQVSHQVKAVTPLPGHRVTAKMVDCQKVDGPPRGPSGEMVSHAEFWEAFQVLSQAVTANAKANTQATFPPPQGNNSTAAWVCDFIRINPAEFFRSKVDVAYDWVEIWRKSRRESDTTVTWQLFQDAFLDRFFPPELREAKLKEFMNLRQGPMIVKEYCHKFKQLSKYALGMMVDSRTSMSKFLADVSGYVMKKYRSTMLNRDMDLLRLMIHAQQIETNKGSRDVRPQSQTISAPASIVHPTPSQGASSNLIELDMVDFDIILGMDWLHSCYASIDCRTRRRWLELLKDYDMSVLYHLGKANVVADALRRSSMGSVAHVEEDKRDLAHEVHRLSRLGVLDFLTQLRVMFRSKVVPNLP
ncbi:hypothetical protein FXO38_14860 [Capsicum annuum]|nr:hypothetical protein FXO37_26749 [Capsicum annuum]KAF3655041.1 hypothetical protein FXO38_14860 [Capsicum annuum]